MRRLGRSVAQLGRALCSGRRGRRFKSSHSDQPAFSRRRNGPRNAAVPTHAGCNLCLGAPCPSAASSSLQPGAPAGELPALAALRGRTHRHRQIIDRRHQAGRTALCGPRRHRALVADRRGDQELCPGAMPARLDCIPGRRRDAEPGGHRASARTARTERPRCRRAAAPPLDPRHVRSRRLLLARTPGQILPQGRGRLRARRAWRRRDTHRPRRADSRRTRRSGSSTCRTPTRSNGSSARIAIHRSPDVLVSNTKYPI